ncbi:MAG: hypothetical protein ACYTE8_01005 [Planctomycetota bacterium]|jgi:hypothetical protein
MAEAATNMTLPGQEVSILLDKPTFKKDQNFVVLMLSEVQDDKINLGDRVNFHLQTDPTHKEWAGVGTVTHIMTCHILNLPAFIMQKHQDPEFKNPMALYDHLQSRVGRLLSPADKVVTIGFNIEHQNG